MSRCDYRKVYNPNNTPDVEILVCRRSLRESERRGKSRVSNRAAIMARQNCSRGNYWQNSIARPFGSLAHSRNSKAPGGSFEARGLDSSTLSLSLSLALFHFYARIYPVSWKSFFARWELSSLKHILTSVSHLFSFIFQYFKCESVHLY